MKNHLVFAVPVAALLSLAPFSIGVTPQAQAEEGANTPLIPDEEKLRELGDLAGRLFQDLSDQVTPMIAQLKALMDDLDSYEAPEMLPNGDIIIRRKPDAPAVSPEPKDGTVDL